MAPRSELAFGPSVIARLLPVRAPFLLVDRVVGYAGTPEPRLRAVRAISANEPVLQGHYVGMPLMPGTLVLESLAQTCGVLTSLLLTVRGFAARGMDEARALGALRNLERRERLDPGYRPGDDVELLRALDALAGTRAGLLAATQVKFVKPVFGGDRIDLSARLTRELNDFWHFEIEATVEGAPVVQGTLSYVMVSLPFAPPRAEG
jgi:3-hydroxymyristoyl/3-hydroxydecanoyl-(acyl carrier protein) dehydratase